MAYLCTEQQLRPERTNNGTQHISTCQALESGVNASEQSTTQYYFFLF